MEKFSLPKDVEYIINKLQEEGYEAYVVGGCVRDILLGRIPKDWDIATSALPDSVISIFQNVIPTGIKHGTVTVMINDSGYEVTTYRIDGAYDDNRHPSDVEFVKNIKEDLARRDFTINAMAYNYNDGLIDPFGGTNDLEQKAIKCVGIPQLRFEEDALRMMRAFRFSAQLGFNIDTMTLKCIRNNSFRLLDVSKERIREEFNRILVCCNNIENSNANRIFAFDELSNIIFNTTSLSELKVKQNNPHHHLNIYNHTMLSMNLIDNKLTLKLAMLFHDFGKVYTETIDESGISHYYGHPIISKEIAKVWLKRYKYDNKTLDKVLTLIEYHDNLNCSKRAIKRLLNKIGEDNFRDLIEIRKADILAQNPRFLYGKIKELIKIEKIFDEILENKEPFTVKDLAINGIDIMALGVPQGKHIGEILNKCFDYIIEDPMRNNREELLIYIDNILQQNDV